MPLLNTLGAGSKRVLSGAAAPALYTFTTATFNSSIYGKNGQSLAQAIAASTSASPTTWLSNTLYFNVTSGIMYWTVPVTGNYRIEVWGARGGSNNTTYLGGYGAKMQGDFALTGSSILKILVGQVGSVSYAGGGGGTFVTTSANSPLIIAGGGASTSPWHTTIVANHHASSTTTARNNSVGTGTPGTGGGGGSGAGGGSSPATNGGAGLTGNGGASTCASAVAPLSFTNGGTGGNTCNSIGGFGGGSGSDGCCQGASGAGGGYNGGAAPVSSSQSGGGGGSYNSGTNQINQDGNTGSATLAGNGRVIITKL